MTDCVHQIITSLERTHVLTTLGSQGPTGPRGPAGPAGGAFEMIAGMPISGHKVVASDENGKLIHAAADDLRFLGKIVGLTENAYAKDEPVEIITRGLLENSFWTWNLGPVYVGVNGSITQDESDLLFVQCIGQAISPTSILINIQPPIIKG